MIKEKSRATRAALARAVSLCYVSVLVDRRALHTCYWEAFRGIASVHSGVYFGGCRRHGPEVVARVQRLWANGTKKKRETQHYRYNTDALSLTHAFLLLFLVVGL